MKKLFSLILVGYSLQAANLTLDVNVHIEEGELLQTLVYDDGSKDSLYANKANEMAVGVEFSLTDFLIWGTTMGVKFDTVKASNGSMSFFRYPVESQLSVKLGFLQAGGGVSYQIAPRISCELTGLCSSDIIANNALGYIAQAGFIISSDKLDYSIFFGGKYTWIDYVFSTGKVTGNGAGIILRIIW